MVSLGHVFVVPRVWEDKVFLTGFANKKLETICLDVASGQILWRATAPLRNGKVPKVRSVNSKASPSAAVNDQVVCVYFDAFGLLGYDHDGNPLWQMELPKAKQPWGVGASPIIADGLVIVAGSLRLTAYHVDDGKEAWTVQGLPYQVSASPVVADDRVFVAAWDLGYTGLQFDSFLTEHDKDQSGTITADECNFGWDFPKFDRNKDKVVTREEFNELMTVCEKSHDSLMAIRLGGSGDVTDSHVQWEATQSLPQVPTVLVYRDLVYTVRNGGILCCYDANTGKRHFQNRLPGGGNYYSSPIAVNGKVYFASEKGVVSVIKASTEYSLLSKHEFEDKIFATPAIINDTMLIRSGETLFAIGSEP